MKIFIAAALTVLSAAGCKVGSANTLPDGYKVWVMNSEEAYVSDSSNELLVGPKLKKVGVTKRYIVTTSETAKPGYIGNLRTSGYSLIERSTRDVKTGMTEDQAKKQLSQVGESMPLLLDFDQYVLVTQ